MPVVSSSRLRVFLPAVAIAQAIVLAHIHYFGGLRQLATSLDNTHRENRQDAQASVKASDVKITHRTNLSYPILEEYTFEYPPFAKIPEPHFLAGTTHRDEFYRHGRPFHKQWRMSPETLQGKITVIKNGSYDPKDTCGYRSNYTRHFPKTTNTTTVDDESLPHKIIALDLPSARHFQHFVDSAIPKLIQAKVYLDKNPDAVIMSHFAHANDGSMIRQLLEKLGIRNKIVPWQMPLVTKELVLICKTPPIHPLLWAKTREILGVKHYSSTGTNKIIWISRSAKNARHGRIAVNDDKVQAYLQQRLGNNYVEYDSNKYSLDKTMQLFQQARIVIGLHGGGLYNILFAPSNTTVVEIMPTSPQGKPLGAMDLIFMKIAGMLQQPYWRLNQVRQARAKQQQGNNIKVNLTQVEQVLGSILLDEGTESPVIE